jgi:hypothetical protein
MQSSAASAQVTSHLVEVGGANREDQELSGIFVSLEMVGIVSQNEIL